MSTLALMMEGALSDARKAASMATSSALASHFIGGAATSFCTDLVLDEDVVEICIDHAGIDDIAPDAGR